MNWSSILEKAVVNVLPPPSSTGTRWILRSVVDPALRPQADTVVKVKAASCAQMIRPLYALTGEAAYDHSFRFRLDRLISSTTQPGADAARVA